MALDQYFDETISQIDSFTAGKSSLGKWNAISETDANGPGGFDCNICLDSVQDPVVTLCGHLYCWPCIYKWLDHFHSTPGEDLELQSPQCPVCKAEISQASLVPLYGRGQTTNTSKGKGHQIPRRPQGPAFGFNTQISTGHSSIHPPASQFLDHPSPYQAQPFNSVPSNYNTHFARPGVSMTNVFAHMQQQQQLPQFAPPQFMIRQMPPQQQQPQRPPQPMMHQMPPPPDQVMQAPRPEQPEVRIQLQRIPFPIRGDVSEPIQLREILTGRDMPNMTPQVQVQRVPLSVALQRAGITPDDLRNIQRMAEERIQQELRHLAAEDSSNQSSGDSADSSDEEEESNSQDESEQQPQILQIGRGPYARNLMTPVRIPVNMMQQETPEEPAPSDRPHFVQPRSVRSVESVLHGEKRVKRCACDCAC